MDNLDKGIREFLSRENGFPDLENAIDHIHGKILELSEFGSKLLFHHMQHSEGNDSNIPITLFMRNYIEILESLAVLQKNGLIEPCELFLRVLMETQMYLLYILEKDTERRSLSFILCDKYKLIHELKKVDGVSEEYKQMKSIYDKDKALKGKAYIYPNAANELQKKYAIINSPLYKEVNEEYLRMKGLKKQKNGERISLEWYSLFNGPQNIQRLAEYLEMAATYDGFYRNWSHSVHGIGVLRGKIYANQEGQFQLIQLRLPHELKPLVNSIFNVSIPTFHEFVKKVVPTLKDEFLNYYVNSAKPFLDDLENLNITDKNDKT